MRPRIKPLSTNTVTGTGTLSLSVGHMFGGFDLNTDGVNVGTIVIRNENASGTILAVSKSISGGPIALQSRPGSPQTHSA